MKLVSYLKQRGGRYGDLSKQEAKVLKLEFPLVKGWIKSYGTNDLDGKTLDALYAAKDESDKQIQQDREKSKKKKKEIKKKTLQPTKSEARSLEKLMKSILIQGVKDINRLNEHLSRPIKPVRKSR